MAKRTQIRIQLETIYRQIDGIAEVYHGRRATIPPNKLPAICIYAEQEPKELDSIGRPRLFERKLVLVSEIHVQDATAEAVEDMLDALCEAREAAVLADETLGGLVESILPANDDYDLAEEGQRPSGLAECRDVITYRR